MMWRRLLVICLGVTLASILGAILIACSSAAPAAAPAPAPASGAAPTAAPAAQPAAPSGQKKNISINTSQVGTANYVYGTAWANFINTKTSLQATIASSGGSIENIRLLGQGKTQFAYVSVADGGIAMKGAAPFDDNPTGYKTLRGLFVYPYGPLQLTVRADSGINKIQDLKGKRVSVGPPGSTIAPITVRVLELHGLKESDYVKQQLQLDAAANAVRDGNLDMVSQGAAVPVSQIVEITSTRGIRLLPLEQAAIDQIVKEISGTKASKIPRTIYKNLANTEDVPTYEQLWEAVTTTQMDTDTVYQAVKALMDSLPDFYAVHPAAAGLTLDSALPLMSVPLHPGAVKYYQEKGIKIPAELMPPAN